LPAPSVDAPEHTNPPPSAAVTVNVRGGGNVGKSPAQGSGEGGGRLLLELEESSPDAEL
jgi:hypothetical protein